MKLSFNNWVYSSFPVWVPAYTLEETIKRIARIGYDAIEIGAAAPHAYPAYMGKERRKTIKKVLDDNGLAVSSTSVRTWRGLLQRLFASRGGAEGRY
jgi:protein FrlC